MPRIAPTTIENAPADARPILENIEKGLGRVPNLLATLGVSTAAMKSYIGQKEAIAKGTLGAKFGESIAIAMASFSKCQYCASAHEVIAQKQGVADEERKLNRKGESGDPKTQAAINLARSIVETRGWSNDEMIDQARQAGLSDSDILEVFTITMFNLFTNYANNLFETENDFPSIEIDEAVAV